MLVDNNINLNKYVSFKDLAKYVFVSGTKCFNPYTSSFKTLYEQSGSGDTRNHQLQYGSALAYGFTFHSGKGSRLCLPEEMVALNPKILFGGAATGSSYDWAIFSPQGSDTFDSEDEVYAVYRYKVTFADGTYCTIRFETAYLDQDGANANLNTYWYERCPEAYYIDQNGNSAQESAYKGKEVVGFQFMSAELVQNDTSKGTISDYDYSGSSLFVETTRAYHIIYSGITEGGSLTTGVTPQSILQSNIDGYSNGNFSVTITPSIGIWFSYTRTTAEYTLSVYPTTVYIERAGTSSMAETAAVTVAFFKQIRKQDYFRRKRQYGRGKVL